MRKRWYLISLLFGIIGGLIMYYLIGDVMPAAFFGTFTAGLGVVFGGVEMEKVR